MSDAWVHTGYAQQIVFGAGTVSRVRELLRTLGSRRALLVTTAGRLGSDEGTRLTQSLGTAVASTFAEVESHVPTPIVQAAVRQASSPSSPVRLEAPLRVPLHYVASPHRWRRPTGGVAAPPQTTNGETP